MTSKQKLSKSKKTQLSRKLVSADKVKPLVDSPIDPAILNTLPPPYRPAVNEAIELYHFCKEKGINYAPAFAALLGALDEAAKSFIMRRLQPELPTTADAQKAWFEPKLCGAPHKEESYRALAKNLKRTLVLNDGQSLIGLLRSCLDYALNCTAKIDGVFTTMRTQLQIQGGRKLLETITRINNFRNTYVAHQKKKLTDRNQAKQELNVWIKALQQLSC